MYIDNVGWEWRGVRSFKASRFLRWRDGCVHVLKRGKVLKSVGRK